MSLKCKPMYLSLLFSAKYNVCCRLSAPQCLLELSLSVFCKCLGLNRFKKAYRCRQGSQTRVAGTWSASLNRYRSPNFAGSNKLSRYFHVIYRSAESKEKYLQPRRFRRCWKNDNFILILSNKSFLFYST